MNGVFPSSAQESGAGWPGTKPSSAHHERPAEQCRSAGQVAATPSSTEFTMLINNTSTPQARPPLQDHGHSRTSSFFSFRNRGHLRTNSMGASNGTAPAAHVVAPAASTQQQPAMNPSAPQASPARTPSVKRTNQPQSPPQQPPPPPQPQPQPPAAPQPLHPEIRSVVQLTSAHAHKIYFSGPLVRRIERRPTEKQPHGEVWFGVWAQLGGTTLSIWDMAQVQEASRQGKEVPPLYVNTTDAFIQLIGAVTTPENQKYSNVFALTTGGSNILLFSCPDPFTLKSWVSALRLSSWEKSRLEEIYTAHLLRITLKNPNAPSTLLRGRLEGWVRIRIAGQTDWKRMWMVISAGAESSHADRPGPNEGGIGGVPTPNASLPRKKRISNLFARDNAPALPMKPIVSMYASTRPKDKKKALLTFKNITQAFAVYPERPELISRSTLIKVEGTFGDEELAAGMKDCEGWVLVMPDSEAGVGQPEEMLKWIIAIHDAFEMYGRPDCWTWDPRDPASLMFAYPVGPSKDLLFLARELAETLDPRDESTSSIRSRLIGILLDRMRGHEAIPAPRIAADKPPTLPPIGNPAVDKPQSDGANFQLPPLSFSGTTPPEEEKPLSPVRRQSEPDTYAAPQVPSTQSSYLGQTKASQEPTEPPLVESSARSPSIVGSVSGRRSLDTQTNTRGSSRVDSTTSVLSKSQTDAHAVLPGTEASRALSATAQQSPPSYTVSSPPVPVSPPASSLGSASTLVTVPKRSVSVLTSPHSILSEDDESPRHSMDVTDRASILTSPHSIVVPQPTLKSPYSPHGTIKSLDRSSLGTIKSHDGRISLDHAPPALKSEDSNNLLSEAGALFYMQQHSDDLPVHRRVPTTIIEQTDSGSDESLSQSASSDPPTPPGVASNRTRDQPVRQNTPMAFIERSPVPNKASTMPAVVSADHSSPSRQGLGRKPSGARAQATTRPYNAADSISSHQFTEEEDVHSEEQHETPSQAKMELTHVQPSASSEADLDALAALSYLSVDDKSSSPPKASVEPLHIQKTPSPTVNEHATQYKSSFAPSKQAAERKAKVQAQQAAHQIATHKPGRVNGKRKSQASSSWNESSEEEEEEEEEEDDDDDDADSDTEPSLTKKQSTGFASSSNSLQQRQQPGEQTGESYSHLRPLRSLPQVPGNSYQEDLNPPRRTADQYSVVGATPPRMLSDGTQIRTQAEFPQPGVARQNLWSQALDPGRTATTEPPRNDPPRNDTFVQLEPAESMTKAFTPQGLLSAGIQDKQDRSAKRQEELARESGASLINVPNKPPPPQMGLLGAITAHERERKREGGVGAALTEREREKRLAEDRQRRFDEHQRQQLDQMQQGGSMYGGQFPGFGMNPMMMMNPMMGMNPMMTGGGMNPMMTGGGMAPMMTGQMGYPGMMPGFNPQHFFAAQQAAQAYQQAMMAFSVAGSQVGGDGAAGTQPLNPNMAGMPGNMGFDPRMSMMGMPMMGQMPMAPSIGMQMTGMSAFDARFPPNMNDAGLAPPAAISGQNSGSRNSSPARRSSPLARQIDSGGHSLRAESPKP
ncbi:hypothetical protein C0989_003488 [Termitomyces sp. Mn162]|nr:hypothetical protein C0989_003488 [Termitomyces sp. Mn162]